MAWAKQLFLPKRKSQQQFLAILPFQASFLTPRKPVSSTY
jgi:hypothetical protein